MNVFIWGAQMLSEERRNEIVNYLEKHNTATVQELVDALDSSAATIRRDLSALHAENRIVKVFGGATSLSFKGISAAEPSVAEKARLNTEEKIQIAEYAASLIQDDDFVYIDSGTTTLYMIDFITSTKSSFVTNGIVHAQKLIERGLNTIIVGGMVKPVTEAVIGAKCAEELSKYHFTKAFMGTNGISLKAGFSTPDSEEALVKTIAVKHSHDTYVLADHSKFDAISPVCFADIHDCIIITDRKPNNKYADKTTIKNVAAK